MSNSIQEAVVPFPSKPRPAKTSQDGSTAVPTDLSAHRKASDTKAIPGSLRYAAAAAQQNDAPPETVSDLARTLVLRNLDASFGNGEWIPEDLEQLRNILRVTNMVARMRAQPLVNRAAEAASKRNKVRYSIGYPSQRDAYLKDDPSLAKYRLSHGTEVHTFDDQRTLYRYVLKTLVDPDDGTFTPEELVTIAEYITSIDNQIVSRDKGEVDLGAEDPEGSFDPDAVPTYNDKVDDHNLIPALEKYLKQFERSDADDQPSIWVNHGYSGDPIAINFNSPHIPSRKITFRDMRSLERWVVVHKLDIEKWWKAHQSDGFGDAYAIRLVGKIEKNLLGMLRVILKARETDAPLDEDKIKQWVYRIDDNLYYIKNDKVRDLFRSLIWDIAKPVMRKYLTDYHLEWLPERVRELSATDQ